ncbi:MAG: T9SS type A sorting domain-containing protein, partial [Bacteroidota bacterium]
TKLEERSSKTLLFSLFQPLSAQYEWTIYNEANSNVLLERSSNLVFDSEGRLWVTAILGVAVFENGVWTRYTETNSNMADDFVLDITIDQEDRLWVGTLSGISIFENGDWTNYDQSVTNTPGQTVYTLGTNNNGDIWIASDQGGRGLTVYDGNTWTNLTDIPSQVANSDFEEFAFTSNNEVWIANVPGLTSYNGSFNFYPKITTGLWQSNTVTIDQGGNIWAGGFAGLLRYDGSNWLMKESLTLTLPENTPYSDILAVGDYLWVATNKDLFKYNTLTQEIDIIFTEVNSPLVEGEYISDIALDANGDIWMTSSLGVIHLKESGVVSTADLEEVPLVQVFPNPSNGQVNIHISQSNSNHQQLQVMDINGRVVFQQDNINAKAPVDLSILPGGFYHLLISDEKGWTHREALVLN